MFKRCALMMTTLSVALAIPMFSFAADVAAGQAVYNRLCVSCHGAGGKGDGPAAAALNPKPRNLVAAMPKGDEYVKKVITQGGAASGLAATMPAWGAALQPGELDSLLLFLKTLK